jgi:hypothetical protein
MRSLMFRCHFTQMSRIVAGENLRATTLPDAMEEAADMYASKHQTDQVDGFEIWDGAKLLYISVGQPAGKPH